MESSHIAANIVAFREAHGWTRAELQRRLEDEGLSVHLTTLRRIELGKQEPKLTEASHYADALGVSLDDLLREPGNTSTLHSVKMQLARAKDHSKTVDQAIDSLGDEVDELVKLIAVSVFDETTTELSIHKALEFLENQEERANGIAAMYKQHGQIGSKFREAMALPLPERVEFLKIEDPDV